MPDELDEHDAGRAEEMLNDPAFAAAVEEVANRIANDVVEHAAAEARAVDLALCVDEEIEVELNRKWTRLDPPQPFGVFMRLMEERPGAWVSPSMSVRMWERVESLARLAYNEATR